MLLILLIVVGLGYLTLLEKKGVSLDPCDMSWKEFILVLMLVPTFWVVIGLYLYFMQ